MTKYISKAWLLLILLSIIYVLNINIKGLKEERDKEMNDELLFESDRGIAHKRKLLLCTNVCRPAIKAVCGGPCCNTSVCRICLSTTGCTQSAHSDQIPIIDNYGGIKYNDYGYDKKNQFYLFCAVVMIAILLMINISCCIWFQMGTEYCNRVTDITKM